MFVFFFLLLFFFFFFLFLFLVAALLLLLDLIRRLISGGSTRHLFFKTKSRTSLRFLFWGEREERVVGQGWIGPNVDSDLFFFFFSLSSCSGCFIWIYEIVWIEMGRGKWEWDFFRGMGRFARRCALLSGPCWRIGWRWFDWSRGRLWM